MSSMQCGAEKAERNRTYTVLPNLRSMVDERNRERMDIEKHGVIQSGHGGKERNMSVVVQMEMPKNCYECEMRGERGFCPIGKLCVVGYRKQRHEDCPIICQLPKGHGRLIDADALHKIAWPVKDHTGRIEECVQMRDLYKASTIVPAEVERSET